MTVTPQTFKAEWTKALRSGDFFQCQNNLFGDAERDHEGEEVARYDESDEERGGEAIDPKPGHCCLGVAVEITGGDPEADSADGEMPSHAWCAKWGVPYAEAENLASLNDSGNTFIEIAGAIDELDFEPYEYGEDDD